MYHISYKTLIGAKPLCIRFDEVDRFNSIYDGTTYLVLFGPEKYDTICSRIRHLIGQKNDIKYVCSHNYPRIKLIHMILCL